jgi:hypothetical protein
MSEKACFLCILMFLVWTRNYHKNFIISKKLFMYVQVGIILGVSKMWRYLSSC